MAEEVQRMTARCVIHGCDVMEGLARIPDNSVSLCVTSPPYWGLRDYGVTGQIGLEPTVGEYIEKLVAVFREARRVLHPSGSVWLNLGSSYANSAQSGGGDPTVGIRNLGRARQPRSGVPPGYKPKDLIMVPFLVAEALRRDGWWLRQACPWVRRNPMPESCQDRPTNALEYMFLLTKSQTYYFDAFTVRRNAVGSGLITVPAGWATGNDHSAIGWNQSGRERNETITRRGHANGVLQYADRDPEADGAQSRHGAALEATAARGSRAWRNSDAWYESVGMLLCGDEIVGFDVNPQPTSLEHFASFPENLVKPCVLSGSSEHGCCAECLAPYERVTVAGKRAVGGAKYEPGDPSGATTRRAPNGGQKEYDARTPGYATGERRKTCRCETDEIVPATILDPFCGLATAGVVALRYGRRFVGIELSEAYCAMAENRLAPVLAQDSLFA